MRYAGRSFVSPTTTCRVFLYPAKPSKHKGEYIMDRIHENIYREAILSFINHKCPPDGKGGFWSPEVADPDLYCDGCDGGSCFRDWFVEQEYEKTQTA